MAPRNIMSHTALILTLVSLAANAESLTTQPVCKVSKGVQRNDALESIGPDTVVFSPQGPGFVDKDGALGMKWGWVRRITGQLIVGGRRLDGAAPPARAYMNDGYGNRGFQSSYLVFPTPGCWEITGRIGTQSLTFVVKVEKDGDGPTWKYEGIPPGGFWYQTTLESGRTGAH
jgi:hypothetical protein